MPGSLDALSFGRSESRCAARHIAIAYPSVVFPTRSWRSGRPVKIPAREERDMGRAYKRYTRQFKQEAMDLVRVRGYGVAHAARTRE